VPAPHEIDVSSWLASAGRPLDPGRPLNEPIVAASTYARGDDVAYSRDDGTPTWAALETLMGGLERGEAVAFASGMAAVAAVFELLGPDAHVVVPDDCYQGVARLVRSGEAQGRWTATWLPVDHTAAWRAAMVDADLAWVESPSNPLLVVADLEALCSAPRRPGSVLAVDNTFATPLNQRPLERGADVSVTSVTKFVGGHSDLLGGVAVARDGDVASRLRETRTVHGATPGALEAFLATRGARTLALRLERSQTTALELARRLAEHPAVERVRYPGLPGHPTHAIAAAQLDGFGSMVTFDVAGGGDAADAACATVRLVRHATSLGGVESSLERRSVIPGQEHLPAGLIRLSVGIEHVEDLWQDLDRALRAT
jgi:cystathionine gamma-synthase